MGVMLHPNKENPLRYRVQVKSLGVNEYFSFAKYGVAKAERLAYERNEELEKKLKARQLTADLGINKLFAQDGSVKGLRRKWRERVDRKSYECLSLCAKKKHTEFVIKNDDFASAYELAQKWLLDIHGLKNTYEIKKMFHQARRKYWHSVKQTSSNIKQKTSRQRDRDTHSKQARTRTQ